MSETKFTPGPWSVTDESLLTPDEPYWIGAEHPEVGRCTFATVRSGCDEADEMGDMLANSHLIAAAPELYSQLAFAVKLLGAFPGVNATAQVDAMRAALSKARGEAA